MTISAAIPLIEEVYCPDVFVSGIGKIEKLDGGMVRISYYAERIGLDGRKEHVITARIVRPLATWPQAMQMVALAVADTSMAVISNGGEVVGLLAN